jgi:plasmid stabilization system protein ParE
VATLSYAARALGDIERLLGAGDKAAMAQAIRSAATLLAEHPLAGRRIRGDSRELLVSYGASGCVALYRFDARADAVRVLALAAQRELGVFP